MIQIFGIPNCDTVRKARKWLDANAFETEFIDFKKTPPDSALIKIWLKSVSWEVLLNKRSTTWRNLSDSDKTGLGEAKAIGLMVDNPSLIKRPVLCQKETVLLGFSEKTYQELL